MFFSSLACEAGKNPVVPGNPLPGGQVAGVNDGSVRKDTGSADDVKNDAGTSTDSAMYACDLLKQDCTSLAYGCYPVDGAGRCLLAGGVGEQGSCILYDDPPSCAPGFACLRFLSSTDIGVCLALCDLTDPAAACGLTGVCQLLPGFAKTSNVGHCTID